MIKSIFISLSICGLALSQTGLGGLEGWYTAEAVSTAGAVGAFPNAESDRINPAGMASFPKQLQLGIVKYPADINAQNILFVKPINSASLGISLRHLGYGNFDAIDEDGVEGGTYSASDTWLNCSWSQKKSKLSWGIASGLFMSNLETYNAVASVLSVGILYDHTKLDAQLGFSLTNLGIYFNSFTDQKEKLPTKLILSANKGLAYLPLNLNFDVSYLFHSATFLWRVGGVFNLPYNFDLSFGINSNTIQQRTEYSTLKSMLGSSGIGLKYRYKQYSIKFGGYTYGSGGWIYGSGLAIEL